jgi:hypothetical protein
VDQTSPSLNRLTANLGKAEALRAEIASIFQASGGSDKSLIPLWESPGSLGRTSPAVCSEAVNTLAQSTGAKPAKGTQLRQPASTGRAAKSKVPRTTSPQPVSVPLGLMSRYNRKELYNKVWRLPMRILAKEFGISDVALAKTCKKLHIPVPGRGYWAKKAANQPTGPRPLLPRVQVG